MNPIVRLTILSLRMTNVAPCLLVSKFMFLLLSLYFVCTTGDWVMCCNLAKISQWALVVSAFQLAGATTMDKFEHFLEHLLYWKISITMQHCEAMCCNDRSRGDKSLHRYCLISCVISVAALIFCCRNQSGLISCNTSQRKTCLFHVCMSPRVYCSCNMSPRRHQNKPIIGKHPVTKDGCQFMWSV